ncbi:MAG: phospholipase [Flammeovirgaceae bacterium]|nr:phospholipase [Flammeovirgaceae bacterium]MBE63335.1 phospholipase [Flammeovirgaceae bacterium]MBR07753.1 phospholipase [Rickettsiales bacterium]
MRKIIDSIIYSFPIQLVFHHTRRNLPLVLLWILFVVTISGGIGKIYGVHYLYLDPEYINKVNFWSFFLVGLAFGNYTMAYHITCYILDSHRFTFVGVLERPFTKFSVNNSLLPLITLIIYVILIVRFQFDNEFSTGWNVILNIFGLLIGITTMLALFYIYFRFTNKDIFKYLAGSVDKRLRKAKLSRERMMNKLTESKARRYEVHSYFDLKLRVRSCKNLQDFYDKEAVLKVFDQNHFNSVIIEIAVIVVILFLGTFMDNPYFQIPAAASSLLMFSIVVMLVGAFSYWLRGWGVAFVFGMFLLVNLLVKWGVIDGEFHARGLTYNADQASYTLDKLNNLNNSENYTRDSLAMIETLNKWKLNQKDSLPNAVFLCVSGGGQRAALWTVNALQKADSVLSGDLMNKVTLISGASGGMIGAAYYRELVYQKSNARQIPSASEQLQRIGRDNLNAVIFSLLVNDAFFRVRNYQYAGLNYLKDRGYVFEQNLSKNLGGTLDKQLMDYYLPEKNAEIPMMLMSPVISNDGRSLYITPLGMSFLNVKESKDQYSEGKIRGVGFRELFANQRADSLSFLTALRMSASFPYITPTVNLPSEPSIEIMDAGIADNFGIGDAVRFIHVFRNWFDQNTSGITFLIIRDTRKNAPIEPKSGSSLIQKLTYPIASVYNNLGNIQDINNDLLLDGLVDWLNVPVESVELEYNTYTNIDEEYLLTAKETERKQLERASLSWHLTTKEKQNVINNIELANNRASLNKLERIMNP